MGRAEKIVPDPQMRQQKIQGFPGIFQGLMPARKIQLQGVDPLQPHLGLPLAVELNRGTGQFPT